MCSANFHLCFVTNMTSYNITSLDLKAFSDVKPPFMVIPRVMAGEIGVQTQISGFKISPYIKVLTACCQSCVQ